MTSDRKKLADWSWAVAVALVLNAALFSLMPGLLATGLGERPEALSAHAIDVIRIRRTEIPPPKKPVEKQKPEEKKPEEARTPSAYKKPVSHKLKLPFEINTRLPEMPGVKPSLYMEKYALNGVDVYDIGDIDKPIAPIAQAPPIYPMRAKRLGIEGWVRIALLVSEKGEVENIDILESEPEGVFESSVLQCVRSWRFSPGTVDGVPVRTKVATTIRFNLEEE